MMKKELIYSALAFAFCSTFALANEAKSYTDNYTLISKSSTSQQNDNRFMQGNFEKIYRYEMVMFDGDDVAQDSEATLQKIVQQAQALQAQKRAFRVTLVSHTEQTSDDKNENAIESQSYASRIQAAFREDFTRDDALRLSKRYGALLQGKLIESGISQEVIFLEYRAGNDAVTSLIEDEDREASHGVFATLYVDQKELPKPELEVKTPLQLKSEPVAAQTPPPTPLDSDSDGVEDAKDECKRTPEGVSVDIHGCPLKSTLKLNFAVSSAEILQDSYGEIERFASFLKANPMYHVEITGHTDSRGKDVLNMLLSQKRAQSTKEALVKAGVEPSRLSTKGRGELDPIASNMLEEGRKANRRIEVELFLKK